ncbi:hypothetical protein B0T19DRAFT_34196 [Cercophora scortea]|uniref:Uncharacterized protein n=1 Tax=Cercophora scortea TaxID=314031 RepID=A0AAE0J3H3_9PEZI|nr:hypothetical protein B0T19DRAFT_34196 [Cercophora scortea]
MGEAKDTGGRRREVGGGRWRVSTWCEVPKYRKVPTLCRVRFERCNRPGGREEVGTRSTSGRGRWDKRLSELESWDGRGERTASAPQQEQEHHHHHHHGHCASRGRDVIPGRKIRFKSSQRHGRKGKVIVCHWRCQERGRGTHVGHGGVDRSCMPARKRGKKTDNSPKSRPNPERRSKPSNSLAGLGPRGEAKVFFEWNLASLGTLLTGVWSPEFFSCLSTSALGG